MHPVRVSSPATRVLLGFVAVLLLLALFAPSARAQAEPADEPAQPGPQTVLTLDQAIALALQNQPNVLAARASLNSAVIQREAAMSPMAILIGPVINVRRKQAHLGVLIARAAVDEAELNTVHAVTRTYLTVIYAQDQLKVTTDAADRLQSTHRTAEGHVKAGSMSVVKTDLDRINTYVLLARTKTEEARQGSLRAKAALRESIGVPDCSIEFAADTLENYYTAVTKFCTERNSQLSCRLMVQAATQCRPEVTQAMLLAQVTDLEVEAQGLMCHSQSPTFAATSDVHARPVAPTVNNGDYRPGPLAPEMPPFLAGSRHMRVDRARMLAQRAHVVAQKVQGLVALEVEDAALRLQEESAKATHLREAVRLAGKNAKDLGDDFRADRITTEKLLTAQVVESQTRGQLNEALYRYAVALAALQHATAGKTWECTVAASTAPPEELKQPPQEKPAKE